LIGFGRSSQGNLPLKLAEETFSEHPNPDKQEAIPWNRQGAKVAKEGEKNPPGVIPRVKISFAYFASGLF
jgi:hypothetical protein